MLKDLPEWAKVAREQWTYWGQNRPPFAIMPEEGQESVWDYPRPPRLAPDHRPVVVRANGRILAESHCTFRVLETASPPTFYIPPHDVDKNLLTLRARSSHCEWKGIAHYWCVNVNGIYLEDVGWSYLNPNPGFEVIAGYVAFYPGRVACYLDEELVSSQPGGLYGGWVTTEIVGPFKGEPGTQGW